MENENKSAASDSADHLCWFCEHFHWSNAVEDWSDVTPGDDFEISCREDHWRFDSFNTSVDEFRAMINTGKTCKDFVLLTELKRF